MQTSEGMKAAGEFEIGPELRVHGEISLAGGETQLKLASREWFDAQSLRGTDVRGVLHDLTKVTAVDCVLREGTSTGTRGEARSYGAILFPHFVAFGDAHLDVHEKSIFEIRFVIDEATSLYYDFDAFGAVLKPEKYIEEIANANFETTGRKVETGPEPYILYFSGKREIFSAMTCLGRVSATHNPKWWPLSDPSGLRLPNQITTNISFETGVAFGDAVSRVHTLLGVIELLIGRPQNLTYMEVSVAKEGGVHTDLRVYWSWAPAREQKGEGQRSHPADVLASPVREIEEFSAVLVKWLETHEPRRLARSAFTRSFADQRYYEPNRLVAAANMFDLLPDGVFAGDPLVIPKEVETAKNECIAILEKLPQGEGRDEALGKVGQIGGRNLRRKIFCRASVIKREGAELFPDIDLVVAEAVRYRNFLVHRREASRYTDDYFPDLGFLIDTLEFIFGASELIESGWSIKRWAGVPTSGAHPFGDYRVDYRLRVEEFKQRMRERAATAGSADAADKSRGTSKPRRRGLGAGKAAGGSAT